MKPTVIIYRQKTNYDFHHESQNPYLIVGVSTSLNVNLGKSFLMRWLFVRR